MKIKFVILIIVIAFGLFSALLYLDFSLRNSSLKVDSCVDCGPYYGYNIPIDLDTVKVDYKLEIPNGQLMFVHTHDKIPPVLIKLDSKNQIKWSVVLTADNPNTCEDVPALRMSSPKINTKRGPRINFFNDSHYEPGYIVLSENYDFRYMCLDMW